uniref:Uncharacterized protein n=1 Tax=Oryza barthii TaxID=65489 RepID=A0A0D3H3G8_9ORYZ
MGELLLFPPVAPALAESAEPTAEARSRRFPLIEPAVAVGSQESSRASPMKLIKLYPHMSGKQKRLTEGSWLPWPRRSQVLEAQT